jgi:hypothetical protein
VSATTQATLYLRSSAMKSGVDEALVPHLHRVAQALPVAARLQRARPSRRWSWRRRPSPPRGWCRQQLEEGLEHLRVEAQVGRELPQDGAQLVAQREQAGGEEVAQRRLALRSFSMCVM